MELPPVPAADRAPPPPPFRNVPSPPPDLQLSKYKVQRTQNLKWRFQNRNGIRIQNTNNSKYKTAILKQKNKNSK